MTAHDALLPLEGMVLRRVDRIGELTVLTFRRLGSPVRRYTAVHDNGMASVLREGCRILRDIAKARENAQRQGGTAA